MSGLFDTLAARFTPDARPSIRPRPQARFEGGVIEEAHGERIASAPRSAPATPRAPTRRAAIPPPDAPERPAEAHEAPLRQRSRRSPAPPPGEPANTEARPRPEPGGETSPERPPLVPGPAANPQTTPSPHRAEKMQDTAVPVPPDPPGNTETMTERIIETTRLTPRPADTDAEARQPDPPRVETARDMPDPAAESPVIRIGQIVVTRPAPPAPPTPKPAPERHAPPRRSPSAPRAAQPSRLTDYLGWKKR